MEEIWKDIEGFEGLYQVSTLGRVRSLDRYYTATHSRAIGTPVRYKKKGVILKLTLNKRLGYVYISLKVNGNVFTKSVHRLVGKAFVDGYFEGADINHKNEDKTDNRAENLEWCTRQYNLTYNGLSKRVGISQGKPVEQMTLDGKVIAAFPTIGEAGRATGLAVTHISESCHSNKKTCGGYRWKFKEQ